MGAVVLNAIQNGLDSRKIHLVGHSLGAQMCGCIGRKVIELSNGTITLPR